MAKKSLRRRPAAEKRTPPVAPFTLRELLSALREAELLDQEACERERKSLAAGFPVQGSLAVYHLLAAQGYGREAAERRRELFGKPEVEALNSLCIIQGGAFSSGVLRQLAAVAAEATDKTLTEIVGLDVGDAVELFRRVRRVVAGEPRARGPKPIRRLTLDEANRTAKRLAKRAPAFLDGGARQWADAIQDESGRTCSAGTVQATPLWKATMQRTGRGRGKGPTPKPVSLTAKLEALRGKGEQHEILNRLVGDEEGKARLAVEESGLLPDEAAAVLDKLRSGEMTPSQAAQVATLHPRRLARSGNARRA